MSEKPRKYNFGASKGTGLSAIANKKWEQGKKEFVVQNDKPVVLHKKELSDVLDNITRDQHQGQPAIVEPVVGQAAPVFGQNLAQRVLEPANPPPVAADAANGVLAAERKSTLGDNDGTNGSTATTAERLRDAAEQYSKDHEKDNIASTSLVDVKTGEENDSTIHQFSCKIYSFDPAKKQWVERGLSSFKINQIGAIDDDGWARNTSGANFRIVARTFGTMKIIINSPVFADMVVEKMDERRIKITAVSAEGGAPQIFLLTSNLAKTDSIGELMFTALKETRERVKRAEEGGNRKRKAERSQESVPESKKVAEEKEEKEKEKDREEEGEAPTSDDVNDEVNQEPVGDSQGTVEKNEESEEKEGTVEEETKEE